jgi:hypothetical protein
MRYARIGTRSGGNFGANTRQIQGTRTQGFHK